MPRPTALSCLLFASIICTGMLALLPSSWRAFIDLDDTAPPFLGILCLCLKSAASVSSSLLRLVLVVLVGVALPASALYAAHVSLHAALKRSSRCRPATTLTPGPGDPSATPTDPLLLISRAMSGGRGPRPASDPPPSSAAASTSPATPPTSCPMVALLTPAGQRPSRFALSFALTLPSPLPSPRCGDPCASHCALDGTPRSKKSALARFDSARETLRSSSGGSSLGEIGDADWHCYRDSALEEEERPAEEAFPMSPAPPEGCWVSKLFCVGR